ncbi:methyltransferase family protein [Nocardiopsis mangrovi]|uniref:Methyltransferase family protein n=1 Tax=Nocardiopsis mangrovi TaxID=1179818 RepID=A0ABV9E1T6_9ACTN
MTGPGPVAIASAAVAAAAPPGVVRPGGLPELWHDPALIRAVALFGPLVAVLALVAAARPTARETAAAVVATAWNAVVLLPLNLVAIDAGWWTFHAEGAVARGGLPVDLWLGWSLLWGALPALLQRDLPAPLVVGVLTWLDLILMPLAAPIVRLHEAWMLGEAVGIAVGLVPAVVLAKWTLRDRRLGPRVAVQAVLAGALLLALPLYLAGMRPAPVPPVLMGIGVQVAAVLLLPGLAAAREFAVAGRGTPLPFEPPVRVVDTGPYAFVRNPMQLCVVLGYLSFALLAWDARPLIGAVVAFACAAGPAAAHEDERLRRSFGPAWDRYRAGVRPWLPRPRPWPGRTPAVLYVARGCAVCAPVEGWLVRRRPTALRVAAAEAHPRPLRRLTYESADGLRATGIAAFGRALEHLHLGWALLGWVIGLPGVARCLGLCADAFGAGPRTTSRAAPDA